MTAPVRAFVELGPAEIAPHVRTAETLSGSCLAAGLRALADEVEKRDAIFVAATVSIEEADDGAVAPHFEIVTRPVPPRLRVVRGDG